MFFYDILVRFRAMVFLPSPIQLPRKKFTLIDRPSGIM